MTRVIFDITVLVNGYKKGASRTGIVRVVECIAKKLVNFNGVEIRFCTLNNIFSIRDASEFLLSSSDFKNIPFLYPKKYDLLLKLANASNRFYALWGAIGRQRFVERVYRVIEFKLFSLLESMIVGNKKEVLMDQDASFIFHSPFLPFSYHKINLTKAIKFVTVYDLIPVLYPAFFSQHTIDTLTKVYEEIDKDTWVLCISETTRQDLLNYKGDKVDPGKVIVTHLAASDHFYKSEDRINNTLVLKKYKIPPVPYVLGLSILDPRKNMIQIIDAYADLVRKEKINDLNLVLVGPAGYDFQKITNAKQKYPDLKNRIIVTGFVADEDLAAVYSEALMFVYPSIYEGFGLPLLEAMKCGVPVITSNNSSMPEVAGDAAILIDPLDRSQLSNAMHELYSDSVLRDRFASLGFERSKLFSWKRCAEETVDAYRKSIA